MKRAVFASDGGFLPSFPAEILLHTLDFAAAVDLQALRGVSVAYRDLVASPSMQSTWRHRCRYLSMGLHGLSSNVLDAMATLNMDWRLLHWQWQALLRPGLGRRGVWFDVPDVGSDIVIENHEAQFPPAFLQRPGAQDWAFVEVLEECQRSRCI
jgi:hypothetical protein